MTLIIQLMPNLSCVMPKQGDQNVFVSGMFTLPPSLSALKNLCASASVLGAMDNEKPSNLGSVPPHPSDAITMESPIFMLECMIFSPQFGGDIPGGGGSGFSLKRISI